MATNPLGADTCNLSVNVKRTVRSRLGRVATSMELSVGELVRRMMRSATRIWHASIRANRAADLDIQALGALRHARLPESEGGEIITSAEFSVIETLILESSKLDRKISRTINLSEAIA